MSISIPKKLRQEKPDWWKGLQENSKRLTTPFDIHATLNDVLKLADKQNKAPAYERHFKWGRLFDIFLQLYYHIYLKNETICSANIY